MSDMDVLQAAIGEWATATFVDRPTIGIVVHMRREVEEISKAIWAGDSLAEEVADVVILCLNLADREGFSARQAVEAKMAKNRARVWSKPDTQGVCEHIRAGERGAAG